MAEINMEKLSAILYITAKSQFHILECEALAKALGAYNKMTFDLVGPKGSFQCRWVDAHYGIFERLDGGSMHVKGFQFVPDIHCENLGGWE